MKRYVLCNVRERHFVNRESGWLQDRVFTFHDKFLTETFMVLFPGRSHNKILGLPMEWHKERIYEIKPFRKSRNGKIIYSHMKEITNERHIEKIRMECPEYFI
jgi:hypothetical protein